MTIIVLDFDDTLFPTTEYNKKSIIDNEKVYQSIKKFIDTVKIFSQIIYIITNASEDWIKHCFLNILKKPLDCLENINIVSTIDRGYNKGINISVWKQVTYENVLKDYLSSHKNIILFIGDNEYDRQGALYIKKTYPIHIVKSIKYKIFPTVDILINQHERTLSSLLNILITEEDLNLEL